MMKRLFYIVTLCVIVILITCFVTHQSIVYNGHHIWLSDGMTVRNGSIYVEDKKIAEMDIYILDDKQVIQLRKSIENSFSNMKSVLEECTKSASIFESTNYSIGSSQYADFEAHFTISDPVLEVVEQQHYYCIAKNNKLYDLVFFKPFVTDKQQQILLEQII